MWGNEERGSEYVSMRGGGEKQVLPAPLYTRTPALLLTSSLPRYLTYSLPRSLAYTPTHI
jgi:hypothetical protein